jgi:hypothetical protein
LVGGGSDGKRSAAGAGREKSGGRKEKECQIASHKGLVTGLQNQ